MSEVKYITVEVQSIDTAPKDGSEIMVYRGDESAVVSWKNPETPHGGTKDDGERAWCIPESDNNDYLYSSTFEDPTHWSPKPVLSDATERPGFVKIPKITLSD